MNQEYMPLPRRARIREKDNMKYPSVTTIEDAVDPTNYFPPDNELIQYASRGKILHAQINHFLTTGRWEDDLMKIPNTQEDMVKMALDIFIVTRGSLKLSWKDCNFLGFWEKYGKDFKPWNRYKPEQVMFNEEHFYCGQPDWPALYRDEPSIVDWKSSTSYGRDNVFKFKKQGAGYSRFYPGVKNIVIAPLNPGNKCGFGRPIIERDVNKYFRFFLNDRFEFRAIFGL